jgi:hypothetical protein
LARREPTYHIAEAISQPRSSIRWADTTNMPAPSSPGERMPTPSPPLRRLRISFKTLKTQSLWSSSPRRRRCTRGDGAVFTANLRIALGDIADQDDRPEPVIDETVCRRGGVVAEGESRFD